MESWEWGESGDPWKSAVILLYTRKPSIWWTRPLRIPAVSEDSFSGVKTDGVRQSCVTKRTSLFEPSQAEPPTVCIAQKFDSK